MECVVCQDFYNADSKVPRVLSCGHSFCALCVKLMLDYSKGCSLICIVCRLPHYALVTSPMQVPYNFALLDLMFGGSRGGRRRNRGMRGQASTRGASMRGRGAVGSGGPVVDGGPGTVSGGPGAGAPAAAAAAAAAVPAAAAAVPVPEGLAGQSLLQIVPASGPPILGTPYGASPVPMSPQGHAGGLPALPAPMSPIGQASGGSPQSSDGDGASSSSDEDECPNRNRKLNAPKPIGDKFRVTLQQSPGMVWFEGRLRDGNSEEFAFNQDAQKSGAKKKSGRNKRRNGNRGRGSPGKSGAAGVYQDPPRDPEEDAILDYLPILGPKPQ